MFVCCPNRINLTKQTLKTKGRKKSQIKSGDAAFCWSRAKLKVATNKIRETQRAQAMFFNILFSFNLRLKKVNCFHQNALNCNDYDVCKFERKNKWQKTKIAKKKTHNKRHKRHPNPLKSSWQEKGVTLGLKFTPSMGGAARGPLRQKEEEMESCEKKSKASPAAMDT